ncbi:TrkH family potassium uptake protein [Lactococcus formosensis]|uniref:TrkH family potassium uptake protein n=1 Tax=Lactococcus formosensis TaxID=1281486 RepID=UPI002096E8A7|nr:TrkH family potassium uptake protein [Lactococcus formosensis]MCO7180223.1 TrkH family potassium uptake protein [Lactococcus formosensis]
MQKNLKKLTALQIIFIAFLTLVIVGGTLLSLPISSKTGQFTHPVDALFTAVSATCVTGLTVIDTSAHWSLFGQVILLLLIEIGGLGFMTLVVSIFLLLNQKMSLKSRLIIQESYSLSDISSGVRVVTNVLIISFLIQFCGSVLLSFAFVPKFGLIKGWWYSVFHAISAYCNAGFDLFGNSLMLYEHSPYVLMVIASMIVCGSLGFIVMMDLLNYKKQRKLSLHTRLALTTTTFLIFGGMILFLISDFESVSNNPAIFTMQSLFLSISQRTAGFSIQEYNLFSQASIFLTIMLMIIGGTSGSTAGGLKTTTIGVLALNVRSIIKRDKHTSFKNRTIPQSVVKQAYESVFLYFFMMVIATFALLLTNPKFRVDQLLFEVISALSTVGLSMGVTPGLNVPGKIIVGILMFIGRVGVFTIIYSLNAKDSHESLYKYPEEKVMVG